MIFRSIVFKQLLSSKGIPEIGQNIKWPAAIGKVFRILDFDRSGTIINLECNLQAKSNIKPYGYLLVESPEIKGPIKLPIIHRDDFFLISSVYDDLNYQNK